MSPSNGLRPGEELERDDSEPVAVAGRRRRLAARLLGRQVARRPEHGARQRERVDTARRGDPEVRDHHVRVAVEQEVRRLDVAVDDALLVRAVERDSGLGEPLQRLSGRDAALAEPIVDGAAVEVLHDDVRLLPVLADVEDRDDVRRAREPRGGQRLAPEARAHLLFRRMALGEELDGDFPLEDGIRRAVDLAHAAAGDERCGCVPLGELGRSDSLK